MDKLLQRILDNCKKYLFLFLIGIIGFLLVVHILFKIKPGIFWLEAEWNAGDILSFGGTILSFVGTLILGCVTVQLSKDNNAINERLVEIENKRELLEKEKRLGCIIFDQLLIEYRQCVEVKSPNGNAYGSMAMQRLTEDTDTIYIRLIMKLTSDSIINKITRKKIKVCKKDFNDDYEKGISYFGWIPFYIDERNVPLGIDQGEKMFGDILILSKSDKNPKYFDILTGIMNISYLICLEYEYSNTLNEKRNIKIQLNCRSDTIIKCEILEVN